MSLEQASLSLLKREQPALVAATGIFFQALERQFKTIPLSETLESSRGGVWGDEVTAGMGFPILRSTNTRGMRVSTAEPAWCDVPQEQADKVELQSGDILVTKASGSADLVGKAALFVHPGDGKQYLFSNFMLALRPNAQVIFPEYLAWFLRSPQALSWRFDSQQTTVGLRNLQTKPFLQQRIPLPEISVQIAIANAFDNLESKNANWQTVLPDFLEEQRRIVARVEEMAAKIEEARELRKETLSTGLALIDAARRNIFNKLLENQTVPFAEAALLERGKFSHRPRNDLRFFGGEHPWIQIAEIESSGKYIKHWTSTLNDLGLGVSKKFKKGTLLISIAATIGAVGILDFDCCIPDSIVGITAGSGVSNEFIYHYLGFLRKNLEDIAPRSAQKNINLQILSVLPFPVTSEKIQQEVIAELDALQAQVNSLEKLQSSTKLELDALLPSILALAFAGEL